MEEGGTSEGGKKDKERGTKMLMLERRHGGRIRHDIIRLREGKEEKMRNRGRERGKKRGVVRGVRCGGSRRQVPHTGPAINQGCN